MPKASQAEPKQANKNIKQCECGATLFQGPFYRGEFVGGTFIARDEIYQCRNCHREWLLAEVTSLAERVTLVE